MKILVISHNVFDKSSNMGKTLSQFFDAWNPSEVAQFFIHSEVPTTGKICQNYYRITDREALKSVLIPGSYGRVFGKDDIQEDRLSSRTDTGLSGAIYQKGRKRTPMMYVLRNAFWKLSRWYSPELKAWLKAFDPDVVFLASGDYSFIYRMADKIAFFLGKPLVVGCFDDYYLHNGNAGSWLGRAQHKAFMKQVRKTMARAQSILAVCDTMAECYGQMFSKPAATLYTSAPSVSLSFQKDANRIAYFGSVGLKRNEQLVALGRALLQCNVPGKPAYIEVYSTENRPEILKDLCPENGIKFQGAVNMDEILHIMETCMAVVHTESFDPVMVERVRFSVSTKIAESLAYGPCLLAYGPKEVASMDYVIRNKAAYAITSREDLVTGLEELISNPNLREEIVANARAAAQKNHNVQRNTDKIMACFLQALEEK